MRTLTFPNTDLTVSVIGLGCGGLGTRTPRDEAFRLLDRFLELGGNFLDTAHIYAAWAPGGWGASERTIGEWLRSRGIRDRVVIGTKGGHPNLDTMNVSRLAPTDIVHDLEESLERLQVDCVDLYWLHRDDPERPVGELVEGLVHAITAGKIRYYGLSNWTPARLQEALKFAAAHGVPGPIASQVGWSLARRSPDAGGDPTMLFLDDPMLAFHRETGLPVVAYSSQAGGFFTHRHQPGSESPPPTMPAGMAQAYWNPTNRRRLERAMQLAVQLGGTANDVALAYLLNQPFPTCALVGCGTQEHLVASCAAAEVALSPEQVEWLRN